MQYFRLLRRLLLIYRRHLHKRIGHGQPPKWQRRWRMQWRMLIANLPNRLQPQHLHQLNLHPTNPSLKFETVLSGSALYIHIIVYWNDTAFEPISTRLISTSLTTSSNAITAWVAIITFSHSPPPFQCRESMWKPGSAFTTMISPHPPPTHPALTSYICICWEQGLLTPNYGDNFSRCIHVPTFLGRLTVATVGHTRLNATC